MYYVRVDTYLIFAYINFPVNENGLLFEKYKKLYTRVIQ